MRVVRDAAHRYLASVPATQREQLTRVNASGLNALQDVLESGEGVAFLGAGVSAPLYPLWGGAVSELVACAADLLTEEEASTCRAMAASSPDAVVEIVRQQLGAAQYREVLRQVFRVRRDPVTGRTWTPTQELVARCNFAGVVTTNYDPGVVNARMAVRPAANGTGFASWTDEDALDRWRTRDVFGDDELPVLYAHGHHNQPEAIVLATTEYRRAYGGKLAKVLGQLVDAGRLVWIGFSFADQRIAAILREIAEGSGTRIDPGQATRHVALMPWDPAGAGAALEAHDPGVLRRLSEIQHASHVVLYPAPAGDHSALRVLLEHYADHRFSAARLKASPPPAAKPGLPVPPAAAAARSADDRRSGAGTSGEPGWVERWVHGGTPVEHFTGREEELARLERWAGDDEVRLIGVTAWGGAGKTALITEWLTRLGGARRQRALRGLFAWSFYEDRSAENWATALAEWVERSFKWADIGGSDANRVVAAARSVPVLLVLDGLEVAQEGPAGPQFGRLLDGTLRDALTQLCAAPGGSLVVLTSRFPFADLEQFDGGAARMLDVPPLTADEGAALLASSGGGWLGEADRLELVRAIDGHALAVAALAGALADRPVTSDIRNLIADLGRAGRTDERVARALAFYAERLSSADQDLVALVSLFQRPVATETILVLGTDQTLGSPLRNWTSAHVEAAVRQRLTGLLSWHADHTVSAHPLVRNAFRPRMLSAASAQLAVDIALSDLPDTAVRSRDEALRVVEMIELLLEANQWEAANTLYRARTNNGAIWKHLPAAQLGERCGLAFAGTPGRQQRCREQLSLGHQSYFVNEVGLFAMNAGDIVMAEQFLRASCELDRAQDEPHNLSIALQNMAECLWWLGRADSSRIAAKEALVLAQDLGDRVEERDAHSYLGAACALAGDTHAADRHFLAADLIEVTNHPEGRHLYSTPGYRWAEFLLRTGRTAVARLLTERNREISDRNAWNQDVARCDRLLGLCDIASGDLANAARRLDQAAATSRDGQHLLEFTEALVDVAEQRRRSGQPEDAERRATEAIVLASPRGAVPMHAAALAARARARGDQHAARGNTDALERARDDADLSLRLATKIRRLPWQELEALEAHALLDRQEGRDRGWAAKARNHGAALIPPSLDPDPLATSESAATQHDDG